MPNCCCTQEREAASVTRRAFPPAVVTTRMECAHLAAGITKDPSRVVALAEELYEFVAYTRRPSTASKHSA